MLLLLAIDVMIKDMLCSDNIGPEFTYVLSSVHTKDTMRTITSFVRDEETKVWTQVRGVMTGMPRKMSGCQHVVGSGHLTCAVSGMKKKV